MATKVLVGTTVRISPEVFKLNLQAIKAQRLPPDTSVDLCYVIDDESEALRDLVTSYGGSFLNADTPSDPSYDTSGTTHIWNGALFDRVAKSKDRLIQWAIDGGYTHLWLVDSDLVPDPSTLWSALSVRRPLVSSVFWTFWNGGDDRSLGPNVWLQHPYGMDGLGMRMPEFWRRLAQRRVTPIAGGGACILIEVSALKKGLRYYPRMQNLPDHGMYRGEDRTFSIRAKALHLDQCADPWSDILHLYHPSERSPEYVEEVKKFLLEPSPTRARYGDLVNFTVQDLEDPNGRPLPTRGRLGGLDIVPELEDAILGMEVGSSRLLDVYFPMYWPVLHNTQRALQVTLLDVKPYGFHPNLSDHTFRGIVEESTDAK